MTFYVCFSCSIVFEWADMPGICPDCGKPSFCEASAEERDEFLQIRNIREGIKVNEKNRQDSSPLSVYFIEKCLHI